MSVKKIISLLSDLENQLENLDESSLKKSLNVHVDKMLRIIFQHITHFKDKEKIGISKSAAESGIPSLADASVRRYKQKK